jgi:hypothetical protein
MSSSLLVWPGQGKQQSQTGSVVDGMWPGEMRQDALPIVERNIYHDHTITARR